MKVFAKPISKAKEEAGLRANPMFVAKINTANDAKSRTSVKSKSNNGQTTRRKQPPPPPSAAVFPARLEEKPIVSPM
ncbi:hypothetical protein OSB04_019081 [Centaurea solstitialis]|uniref:Uncharacterized protein n=1 Tax=Centaurea solstitialis TaxID=347529 RepID=A0AA38SQ65_9ASTR|nr:hypothetical protein OSB04_019081 [Centaurea solstitialis]